MLDDICLLQGFHSSGRSWPLNRGDHLIQVATRKFLWAKITKYRAVRYRLDCRQNKFVLPSSNVKIFPFFPPQIQVRFSILAFLKIPLSSLVITDALIAGLDCFVCWTVYIVWLSLTVLFCFVFNCHNNVLRTVYFPNYYITLILVSVAMFLLPDYR